MSDNEKDDHTRVQARLGLDVKDDPEVTKDDLVTFRRWVLSDTKSDDSPGPE